MFITFSFGYTKYEMFTLNGVCDKISHVNGGIICFVKIIKVMS